MNKYNILNTKTKIKKALAEIQGSSSKFLAVDTETTGLHFKKNVVVGISFAVNRFEGYYLPILEWEADKSNTKTSKKQQVYPDGRLKCVWTGEYFSEDVTPKEHNVTKRLPFLAPLLEAFIDKKKLLLHNAPFDRNMILENLKVDIKENIFCDTALLHHCLDENNSHELKKIIEDYRQLLKINPYAIAAQEKAELKASILKNGGKGFQVWRADFQPQSKYACSDAFFTYGIFEGMIRDFSKKFGEKGLDWFFNKEVMPVCKEVVLDMKYRGVYIDLPHFEKIHKEATQKLYDIEDSFLKTLNKYQYLQDFKSKSLAAKPATDLQVAKAIIDEENLPHPTLNGKVSYSKKALKDAYQDNPHWIYGFLLGEDEIKYSDKRVQEIKTNILQTRLNLKTKALAPIKRYAFNLASAKDLEWLFCDRLGIDRLTLPQTEKSTPTKPRVKLNAATLKEFMLPKFPWVKTLLSYKKLCKIESTYIRAALNHQIEGWLYMDMKQNGTTSGRFSCSGGYNLQTLPRVDDEMEILGQCQKCDSKNVKITEHISVMVDVKCQDCGHEVIEVTRPSVIKAGFIAPPGYKIINADFASLEPKCFAEMSGEQALKDVYFKKLDLYSQVYCEIFDVEKKYSSNPKDTNYLKKVANEKRKWIKPLVLGIVYGMEAPQIAMITNSYKKIKTKDGEKTVLDVSAGEEVIEKFLGRLHSLRKYMSDQELKALTLGYVETVIGRRRHLPEAYVINKIFDKHGYDIQDLRTSFRYKLEEPNPYFVNKKTGSRVSFSEEALNEICEELKIKDIKKKKYWAFIKFILKEALNNAKNNPIQGLAAHITNVGMLMTNRGFKYKKMKDSWVSLQIHDEIMSYSLIEEATIASKIQQYGMENNYYTKIVTIPMEASPVICDNLVDAK